MIKCFQSSRPGTIITEVNYGPYDNGHICLGFNTGHILILNSFDLASIYRTQVFQSLTPSELVPVSQITFDPLNMMLVTSLDSFKDCPASHPTDRLTYAPLLAGISLIHSQADYKYLQMGPQSYMTLVIQNDKVVGRSRSKGALARSKSRGVPQR